MISKIFLNFSFLLCMAINQNHNLHASEDVHINTKQEIISNFVSDLKGIELYFMLETIEDNRASLQKMKALLDYLHEKAPAKLIEALKSLQAEEPSFAISNINTKSGYLSMYGIGSEWTASMTYWNIDKNRKLVASLVSTCTMICESNSLDFMVFKDDKILEKNYHVDIPSLLYKPEYFLKDINNTKVLSQDPFGVMVRLPEKGMDIVFELDPLWDNRVDLRGNCVRLAWDKKKANFNLMPPEFCKR